MWIRLKLVGFPDLRRRLGGDEVDAEFEGQTLGDLARWLQAAHGDAAGVRVAHDSGRLDSSVLALRNGQEWITADPGTELRDGDEVTLVVLIAGG